MFSGPGPGSWVPSPLVGEGQEEGEHGLSTAHGPLSLALSHEGRGDSENKTAGEELKLGLVDNGARLYISAAKRSTRLTYCWVVAERYGATS